MTARQDPWQMEITQDRAEQIRKWRVSEDYSWRGVASAATERWASTHETNQLLGMGYCRQAAELLGEHYMKEPWN